MARRRRLRLPEPLTVRIESMSDEGRGIAYVNGKTIFVFGALVGERVKIQVKKTSSKFDEATTLEVLEPSKDRIDPKCKAFDRCGGCSLQHLSYDNQVLFKQRTLFDRLEHAGIQAFENLPPLRAAQWGYRRKARLGVKYVRKKGRVLVGFRERGSGFLTDMSQCEVLIPQVGHRLAALSSLIASLDAKETIPQIEVAADETHISLVFRHLKDLSEDDKAKLVEFSKQTNLGIQLQSKGPDSINNLYPKEQSLHFSPLADGEMSIEFAAIDFVQVHNQINQQMVARALQYLDLKATDNALDLFCGLGNFTLPMAGRSASVVGVEGDRAMLVRAKKVALEHGIDNISYHAEDLTQPDQTHPWMRQKYDKILLDPPRSGAMQIAQHIQRFKADTIVYISCQPASLVRDIKIICGNGYHLTQAGMVDMFPQTARMESMAVLKRQ